MSKKLLFVFHLLLVGSFLLAACGGGTTTTELPPTEVGEPPEVTESQAMTEEVTEAATEEATEEATTEAPAETTEAAATTEAPAATEAGTPGAGGTQPAGGTAPEGALVSVRAETAPELDGDDSDEAWGNASEITIEVTGGVNNGSTEVVLKSVYTDDTVYFLATWEDPTQSWGRSLWEKLDDGTWQKQVDPQDKGGDNNLYYEDKISFIWPINNSIPGFEDAGCFVACHAGENSDEKPYGNKYTAEEGQTADIWHWKSVRNLNQVDDQYLDHVRFSADTPEAGRHSDPKDAGGYVDNQTEDRTLPLFMQPDGGAKDGSPGFILDAEKVDFDDALFAAGDLLPSVVIAEATGDRGNISAGWQYVDGMWVLEFSRPLTTGSEFDVQFDDLAGTYYFGVATFDNAQVRHAFQTGATAFVFQP